MINTIHNSEHVHAGQKEEEIKKPISIVLYEQFMNGGDHAE
jgi:hypothetical protein